MRAAIARHRWKCPHCHAEGWGAYGPHDRTEGRACRPSGQVSEREAAARHLARLRAAQAYYDQERALNATEPQTAKE